jgi:hypothetical protein
MKLGVAMLWDSRYWPIANWSFKINMAYCLREKMDLIARMGSLDPSRDISWSKIKLLLDNLEQFDWLVWCDADAALYGDIRGRIEQVEMHKWCVINKDFPASGAPANCGVFAMRNCQRAKEFLWRIWLTPSVKTDTRYWEQLSFNYWLLERQEYSEGVAIVEWLQTPGYELDMVAHHKGGEPDDTKLAGLMTCARLNNVK